MKNMFIKAINDIWNDIINDVENRNTEYSSEKSLCFNYAWKLKTKFKDNIYIDFEKSLFESFSDGTFLDLYAEIKEEENIYKIGFEFKFLKSDNTHNTNQTQSRIKIINDIKRLTWLKKNKKIDLGCFLCATNEMPYINIGNKKESSQFKTYQNIRYVKGQQFPIHEQLSKESLKAINDIAFNWNNIISIGNTFKLNHGNKFAWLTPILIE